MTLTQSQALVAARSLWAHSLHKRLEDCPQAEQAAAITVVRELAAAIPFENNEVAFGVFLLWMGENAPTSH